MIPRLPEQILPVAQGILDDLLSQAQTGDLFTNETTHFPELFNIIYISISDINTVPGAPDPTLGGAAGEQAAFCLDARNVRDNILKILVRSKIFRLSLMYSIICALQAFPQFHTFLQCRFPHKLRCLFDFESF